MSKICILNLKQKTTKIAICFLFLFSIFNIQSFSAEKKARITDYKNFAFIVSGPSGVGKTTVVDGFVAKHKNEVNVAISTTTRAKRGAEVDGKDYYFVSKDSFKKLIDKGEFLEYSKNYDNYYGSTIRNYVESQLAGKEVIYNLSVDGMKKAKKNHPKFDFVTIFMAPPSLDVLYQRLKNRNTETEEQVKKRFSKAKEEMEHAKEFDYVIYNCNVDDTVKMFETIYLAEQRKRELPRDKYNVGKK